MKNKSILIMFSIFLIVGFFGCFFNSDIAEAASNLWNSCNKGRINCSYPGRCHSYTDTNKDNICDRSQSAPQAVTSQTSPTTPKTNIQKNSLDNTVTQSNTGLIDENAGAGSENNIENFQQSYYFIPILFTLALFYSITWFLSNKRFINQMLHRKIWNVVLLISIVVSALLGLLLILNIDFNLDITLPFNMIFWHVEAGIALSIISCFHIIWHRKYFLKMFKISNP